MTFYDKLNAAWDKAAGNTRLRERGLEAYERPLKEEMTATGIATGLAVPIALIGGVGLVPAVVAFPVYCMIFYAGTAQLSSLRRARQYDKKNGTPGAQNKSDAPPPPAP